MSTAHRLNQRNSSRSQLTLFSPPKDPIESKSLLDSPPASPDLPEPFPWSSTPNQPRPPSTAQTAFDFPPLVSESNSTTSVIISPSTDDDLIDINMNDGDLDLSDFDPLSPIPRKKELLSPVETSPRLSPNSPRSIEEQSSVTSSTPLSSSIRFELKFSPYAEMKPFQRFVQRIRKDFRTERNSSEHHFYSQRVQHLTRQHLEHKQSPVTLYIFVETSVEPIRLSNISLQSTVAHILYQLCDMLQFDYDHFMLKLRSREEYLRHEDVLCDIEYVYHCLNSFKPLEFLLVRQRPIVPEENSNDLHLSFEQFCLQQQDKYFYTGLSSILKSLKPLQATKSSSKQKPIPYTDCIHSFFTSDAQWLENFRISLEKTLKHIEKRFNQLINRSKPIQSIDEFESTTKSLLAFFKDIQKTCFDVPSEHLAMKQGEIRAFVFSPSPTASTVVFTSDQFVRLLYDLLDSLDDYFRNFFDSFLIPYELEIRNEKGEKIDLRPSVPPLMTISHSSELLTLNIGSVLNIPSTVKYVRLIVRLCYGNQIRANAMTPMLGTIRNTAHHQDLGEVRFDHRLTFNDIFICGLYREAVLLFELFGNVKEKSDGASNTSEIVDGIPMRLIAWCSQALFDDDHRLITGEKCFGLIDGTVHARRGFSSLRNIFQQKCSILTVDFLNQSVIWPEVQPRNDMEAKSFTEISLDRQESLSKLLDRSNILLNDHSTMTPIETMSMENRKPSSNSIPDERREFTEDECHFLWSHRYALPHKPYALPKLLRSRSVWDYPSLIDIYGLIDLTCKHRSIDQIEAFELLLPAFPDMFLRSRAYRWLIANLFSHELIFYLPQLLQMIKFDYDELSPIIEYLLEQSMNDLRLAHQFYWYLRQALQTETIHFRRYYHIFMSLLFILPEKFRVELQNEFDLCVQLKKLGLEIKKLNKPNRMTFLLEQLKELNEEFFRSGQHSCRLPCQIAFITNGFDLSSCSVFDSFTVPMKLVFQSVNNFGENYSSIYKIGDDLRQDQIVIQLFAWMDRIWQWNSLDFRLSLFNVVQVQERCGFIEMINESETMMEIESRLGTIKGTFSESALYLWLRSHHTTDRDLRKAIDNLTYSCAAYCVATYILGIGDRHNENIMVKKSGHLFHIDFGKYLGDTQKFGSFNRDRAPFIFTKQMLYAMSEGGVSKDAMHRFVDLCCNAYETLRENSSLILLLLAHLCPLNVPNLNCDAVRFVYDRLAPSLTYAESVTRFTGLIVDSLNSSWTNLNHLIHGLAHTSNSTNPSSPTVNGPTLSFVANTYTVETDGKVQSARVVKYEKRSVPYKHYLYKLEVKRLQTTYHYRTYAEFYEFSEALRRRFPLIGLNLKSPQQTEEKLLAQRHVSRINDFLEHLFHLADEIVESDVLCTFFHTIPRDQQINDATERAHEVLSPRSSNDSNQNNQPKIRIQLIYESGKLNVMVRHATNLPMKNGNEPRIYCKCRLFPDENKTTKQKGKKISSQNPLLNDTFVYEMDLAMIQERVLRVSVWNDVRTGSNRVLGEVKIILSEVDWSKESIGDYNLKPS